MKTCFVTAWVSNRGGGVVPAAMGLAKALIRLPDVDLSVFGLEDKSVTDGYEAWKPLIPETFPLMGPSQLGFASGLGRRLAEKSFDLCHTHGIWLFTSRDVLRWHENTGRPYVITPHGMLDRWIVHRSRWKKKIACWLFETAHLNKAACIHALCQSEAESIRAFGLKNPIAIIPNGVVLPDVPVEQLAVRKSPLLPIKDKGLKVLLFLGRIHPKKGLADLIKAWKAVGAANSGWVLAIAGWDQLNHEAEIKKLCGDSGLSWSDCREPAASARGANILFLGPRFGEDKAICLTQADAFILPSHSEGLPMSVLEAWSFGKPVVMTDMCNLPEGFAAGAAWRIDLEPGKFANQLRDFLSLPATQTQEMGHRGLNLVVERFTWDKVAADMHAVYQWVLGAGPKPAHIQ